jgi:pilus assembly protein CpaE
MTMLDPHGAGHAGATFIPPLPRVSIQAFCETADVKHVMKVIQTDRRMAKVVMKVQDGGVAACLQAYRGAPTPNVIIIEASHDSQGLLTRLDELAQYCDAGTQVVVIGVTNDVVLYRELIKRGVSDYLIQPVGVDALLGSLSNLYASDTSGKLGRVVSVIGARGGVGSSTIAHNMAFSIASGCEIATTIIDLDLAFGTAGLNFNQDPPQGIADAIYSPERLDINMLDRLSSKCAENLTLLAAPSTLDRAYDMRETDVDAVMDLVRGTTPMVVVDLPHVWTAWSRRVLVGSDEIVIVGTPDLASLRNVKSLLDTLKSARPNDAAPTVLLNMVGVPKRPEIQTAEFAKALDCDVFAALPFDPVLFGTAANNGQMLAEVQAKSKVVEQINDLARKIAGRGESKSAKSNSLLAPLLSRLKIKAA